VLWASTNSKAQYADWFACVALVLVPTTLVCTSAAPVVKLLSLTLLLALLLALHYAFDCELARHVEARIVRKVKSKPTPWSWAEWATRGALWWSATPLWVASAAAATVIGGSIAGWTGAATVGMWLLVVVGVLGAKGAAPTARGGLRTQSVLMMVLLLATLLVGMRMAVPAEGVDGVSTLPSPFAHHQTRSQDMGIASSTVGATLEVHSSTVVQYILEV
jgi:hypothetical protein